MYLFIMISIIIKLLIVLNKRKERNYLELKFKIYILK